MEILLLTGTINPNGNKNLISTVLSDKHFFNPEYRLKEYITTIIYYITVSNFSRIIFCENSGYDLTEEIILLKKLAKYYGKEFEFLQFIGDTKKISKYSYHYGEAEIFDYVFLNSKFIEKGSKIFKVTGRYKIQNINSLLKAYKDNDFFFYKGFGLNSTLCVNTAFFMVKKEFYDKFLLGKQIRYYETYGEKKFIPLEGVFYQLLKTILFKQAAPISEYPIFHFFNTKILIQEHIKKYLGLLDYGNIAKILDFFLPKAKKFF